MASIATVVTMGFGSFGSVNLLPTIGYGISETLPPRVTYRPLVAALPSISRPIAARAPAAVRYAIARAASTYRPVTSE